MTSPSKPWETAGANQRVDPVNSSGEGLFSSAPTTMPTVPLYQRPARTAPPPLPPRPGRNPHGYGVGNYYGSSYPSYGGYSGYGNYSGINSYGYGGYGGYGSYGAYGGYGMNRMGFPRANNPESRFILMAEEGSRPAFQSIESLVHAFGSVSFMLESTYSAMYSSFRAVLGVAENFGRLRELFGQFLSIFALFRWFRWLYRKGLYLLGLSAHDPGRETLWQQATQGAQGAPNGVDPNAARMSWPIMVFLGIIFSGPYLMWKLLGSLNIPETDKKSNSLKDWTRSKDAIFSAVSLYDFSAASEQELNIAAGQKILIAPKECQPNVQGWLLASVDGRKAGFVPANYIKIVGKAVVKRSTANPNIQAVNPEIATASGIRSELELAEASLKAEGPELFARVPMNEGPIPEEPSTSSRESHIPGPSGDGPSTDPTNIQVDVPEKNEPEPVK